ncbi:hypothetical protein Tco_1506526 [Tanacetum coccineum]
MFDWVMKLVMPLDLRTDFLSLYMVRYLTDAVLLRESLSDPELKQYSKLNMGGGDGFDVEGDEDDSDTEEEVKEEEAIGKQEVAPPVSNQVDATT